MHKHLINTSIGLAYARARAQREKQTDQQVKVDREVH